MLLEFGGRNFYSFKEGFQINLREKGNDISNILAIKGSNASGKTNVLKAISFLDEFSKYSFSYKTEDNIPICSFFNNEEPINLYIIFSDDTNTEYKYNIELTNKKVLKEQFFCKNKLIIERTENKITENKLENNGFQLNNIILKDNSSLLSTAEQYKLEIIDIYFFLNFFAKCFSNINRFGLIENVLDYYKISKLYFDEPQLLNFTKDFLKKSDTGIKDIRIIESYDEEKKSNIYFPAFLYDIDNQEKHLIYSEQSSGVKTLYKQLAAYKKILDLGGILILDELDINLHPDLIPPLIYFFNSKELNPKNAQLLFTTHNTEIMDKLTKYKIVLVNKEDNESYLYRLDETGEAIRNDRSISKLYNTGKLGGKPNIELDYD